MKRCLLVLICFLMSKWLNAQSVLSVSDYQILRNSNFAQLNNASSSWVNASCRNDYFLKEMMTADLTGTLLFGDNAVAFQCSHEGYSKYGNLTSSIGYSRKFAERVSVGLRFYYLFQHVEQYESVHSVTFDISLHAVVSKKLSFGFEVYNPARLKYGVRGNSLIPMMFRVQAQYVFSDKLLFLITLHKHLPGEFDVVLGAYYRPTSYFFLSFDVSLMNADVGVMLRCRSLYFTIDFKYNYRLGFSPEIGLAYRFPHRK